MKNIRTLVAKTLQEVASKIDSGTCELSEAEAMEILDAISHQYMSKDEACSYLNLSRSRFDDLVRLKQLPRGKKRRGFKELFWYRDELNNAINNIKINKHLN